MNNLYIIILIFYFYSFIGWVIEVLYGIYSDKKVVNRGFLIGPICPIYGIGCVLIILLLDKYHKEPITLFFMCIVICSILEYSTSYLMEKIFKNRWWDYSYFKYNINGRICLETMVPFGLLGLLIHYGINPLILSLYSKISMNLLIVFGNILIFITIIDIIFSFKVIINLKYISSSLKSDSTEIITKKVKEALMAKNILYRRLVNSFPNMKVFNKMSILKDKIKKDKYELKNEKKKRSSRK